MSRLRHHVSPHTWVILQALLVTFLWSTSWVLIKIGLRDDIPPLTFAGLRYTLAFLCLLPLGLRRASQIAALRALPRADWLRLGILGVLLYSVTQGAQFVGLNLLPAITVNLLLTFIAVVVAGLGIIFLGETPSRLQWVGLGLYLCGAFIFFYPAALPADAWAGVGVVVCGVMSAAVSALLGRSLNRRAALPPLAVTLTSMGVGGPLLLAVGIVTAGMPPLTLSSWLIVAWLAVVNTALAFTLWNNTLRTLSALESSIINNLMMVQIPVLAWIFLGESVSFKAAVGMTLAGVGVLVVQLRGAIVPRGWRRASVTPAEADPA